MKMTKVLMMSLAILLAGSVSLEAQINTPAPSPSAELEQTVGLTEVQIEYSRPGIKGRTIFGDLVPYGQAWRTGANQATKITFSDDVMLNDKEVKKGSYAIITKPMESSWEFMLYPHVSGNWSSYGKSDVEPITFTSNSMKMGATVENFLIVVDEITSGGANIYFMWDNTMVPVKLGVHTDKSVEASIEKTMAGPSAGDYSAAASYYLAEGKDMNKALDWINKSISMDTQEKFWILRTKSLIQAKLGDKMGAMATAKKSLELATTAENNDYIKMNKESIKEWSM